MRLARIATLALGGLLLLSVAQPSSAVPDNQGTVKIQNLEDLGQQSNDPKPGCPFYVEGFGMEAMNGTLVIKQQGETGNATVISTNWTADDTPDDGFPDHHFLNGPFNLTEGHYKLFVSNAQHDKMKVFKVECSTETSTNTTTTTNTTTNTTTGLETTEVPVFPTATAAVLATAGALAGSIMLLRRRT